MRNKISPKLIENPQIQPTPEIFLPTCTSLAHGTKINLFFVFVSIFFLLWKSSGNWCSLYHVYLYYVCQTTLCRHHAGNPLKGILTNLYLGTQASDPRCEDSTPGLCDWAQPVDCHRPWRWSGGRTDAESTDPSGFRSRWREDVTGSCWGGGRWRGRRTRPRCEGPDERRRGGRGCPEERWTLTTAQCHSPPSLHRTASKVK